MSTYKQISNLVHDAVFLYQSANADEVIRYITINSNLRNLDRKEISRIIDRVCTPYKASPDASFTL